MPATATRRKPTTSDNSTAPPPKKKLKQTTPQVEPSSSIDVISTPPAAPVLSAVAARRAAAAAASSATSAASSSRSTPIPSLPNPSTIPPEQEPELQIGSDASDSETEDEATLLAKDQSRRKGKEVKGKRKEQQQKPSRYFSGPAEEEMRLEQSEDGYEARDSRMVSEEVREPLTPKAARPRRRREKTAFIDPECYSNFRLEESSNAWSTNITREDGSTCEGVVYGLRIGEDLVIHGTFEITPLSGSFSLLGSTVSSSPSSSSSISLPKISSSTSRLVHCPASHPLPPISAIPNDLSSPGPSSLSLYLDVKIDISSFAAVVLVAPAETGIEGIELSLKSGGLGCANGLYPMRNAANGSVMGGKGWRLILEPLPGLTILRQLEPWTFTLADLVPQLSSDQASVDPGRMTVMVEGPKRVGKSTFSKMLLNRLLDRYEAVAYLDTDLGQPEFSTPGFVSLNVLRKPAFGPAFTHLSLPISSHYLGSASPASDPTSYISAISALLSTYALEVEYPLIDEPVITHSRRRHRDNHQASSTLSSSSGKVRERVPLVINTQGWVKGLGADLLEKLKAASQPTHVCSFVSPMEEENGGYSDGGGVGSGLASFQQQAYAEEGLPYRLYTLPAAPMNPLESKWTASDYRTLSFTSYFHSLFTSAPISNPSGPTSTFPDRWDFSSPLIAQTPYSLDWNPSNGQISSVHLLDGDDVAYEHVLHCLNGSLVAIVESTSPSESTSNTPSSFPYDPLSPVPHPPTSRALGLGLIRSIAPSSTSLHLLTPIPPPTSAISLVKGSLEVPLTLMLDHTANESEREQGLKGENWREVPFLSIEEGEGAGRRRVRRNLMRRGHT